MPYVDQDTRDKLDPTIEELILRLAWLPPGALNYALSRIAAGYLRITAGYGPSYAARANVYGHFAAALGEFKRRVLDRYEERKLAEGARDVPEYEQLDRGRS